MGICQSKKEKGSNKNVDQVKITDINDIKIGKSDFIQSNNGKFKDHYQIG
jgi:hypothetical protein